MSFLAVFLASLAGSPHCAGMCGGFVALYSGRSAASGSRTISPHLAYNTGRVVSYSALGASAGVLGKAFDGAGRFAGLQHSSALVLCIIMLLSGLALLGAPGLKPSHPARPHRVLGGLYQRLFARATELGPAKLAFALGSSSVLLPCGWLYLFVAAAASTASPLMGAALMIVFWAGSLPLLLSLGKLSSVLSDRMRRALPRATAVVLILSALVSFHRHLTSISSDGSGAPSCHETHE